MAAKVAAIGNRCGIANGSLQIIEPVTGIGALTRRVVLMDQKTWHPYREQWSDPVTGLVSFQNVAVGPWILFVLNPTVTTEGEAIVGRMASADGSGVARIAVSGTVLKYGGGAVDQVSLRSSDTGKHWGAITPDSQGNWTIYVPSGNYDITYFVDGCPPVCSGPYMVI